MTEQVRAICFPHDDVSFAARVRTLVGDGTPPDEPLRATVEALLRRSYPLAVVAVRHPYAAFDERPTWYVYRDGGLLPRGTADQGAPAAS